MMMHLEKEREREVASYDSWLFICYQTSKLVDIEEWMVKFFQEKLLFGTLPGITMSSPSPL
jgi:hypothetical protein